MIEIGRLCVKTAGRDAGLKCVVVDILDNRFVLIDGQTRRRKCNVMHLEPLSQVVEIKKNSDHEEVAKALKELGIESRTSKPKPKTVRPLKKRKTSEQLRAQKEEKKKLQSTPKKKEDKPKAKKETLEDKAGLAEEKNKVGAKEEKKEAKPQSKPLKEKSAKKATESDKK